MVGNIVECSEGGKPAGDAEMVQHKNMKFVTFSH